MLKPWTVMFVTGRKWVDSIKIRQLKSRASERRGAARLTPFMNVSSCSSATEGRRRILIRILEPIRRVHTGSGVNYREGCWETSANRVALKQLCR